MAHNIIRRSRIVDAFRRAVDLGASRDQAFHTVGQSLGLEPKTVEWCVDEADSNEHQEQRNADQTREPRTLPGRLEEHCFSGS